MFEFVKGRPLMLPCPRWRDPGLVTLLSMSAFILVETSATSLSPITKVALVTALSILPIVSVILLISCIVRYKPTILSDPGMTSEDRERVVVRATKSQARYIAHLTSADRVSNKYYSLYSTHIALGLGMLTMGTACVERLFEASLGSNFFAGATLVFPWAPVVYGAGIFEFQANRLSVRRYALGFLLCIEETFVDLGNASARICLDKEIAVFRLSCGKVVSVQFGSVMRPCEFAARIITSVYGRLPISRIVTLYSN